MATEGQSFLNGLPSNSATFDRRIAAAGDWFDSDCVLGTQFESSQPHHAVRRLRRFPKQTTNARNWRASWRGESLCERPAVSGAVSRFCLWPRNLRFPETGDVVCRDSVRDFFLDPRKAKHLKHPGGGAGEGTSRSRISPRRTLRPAEVRLERPQCAHQRCGGPQSPSGKCFFADKASIL